MNLFLDQCFKTEKTMKEKKGISVIIPTFNRAKFLYPTIICLLNQKIVSDIDYEIIIIDSGNEKNDKTREMISYFQNQTTRLKYKKISNNKNRSLLRHVGAKLASFNILLFLDNDMLTPPNYIEYFYNQFTKPEKEVLLGRRKSLIEFNMKHIGEKNLAENFYELDKLPWYDDERMFESFNDNPWQYAFSHSLFLYKKDYFKVGGFNKKFGKQWGLEDIELGYKLAELGCTFKFITNCSDYHQPHFSQSAVEQPLAEINRYLMAQIHNSCDEEIMLCFFYNFSFFKNDVLKVKSLYSFKKPNKHFDLFLGCIHELGEKKFKKTEYLGLFLPFGKKSINKIYIYDSFFLFCEKIQIAILAQAFRVGKEIWIRELDSAEITNVKTLCFKINILLDISSTKGFTILKKNGKSNQTAITMLLPDITEVDKRFVYKWLALKLISSGIYVNLLDKRRIKIFDTEDFKFKNEENEKLSSRFDTSYGYIEYRTLDSMDSLRREKVNSTKNEETSLIIHDDNYLQKYSGLEKNGFEKCVHFDNSCYQFLIYACTRAILSSTDRKKSVQQIYDYCIFMNKGFFEDGIDIAIELLRSQITSGKNKKMVIKICDYEKQFSNSYPRHNKASQNLKLYRELKAYYDSLNKLNNMISKYNLENKITLIKENWEITQIIDLINSTNTFLFTSRECNVSPLVFFSILLNKKVIMAKGHNLISPFNEYVLLADSEYIPLSQEYNIPYTIENAASLAVHIKLNSVLKIIDENIQETISDELLLEIDSFVNDLYKKIQNRKYL